jgi:hypothetical protein
MSSKNWKPWWEKVGEYDTPHEREEFMRGMSGIRPMSTRTAIILSGIIAGYVSGKISRTKGKK